MFRQRTSAQKPAEDLLANFRLQFPEVNAAGNMNAVSNTNGKNYGMTNNSIMNSSAQDGPDEACSGQDRDRTPRPAENWRLTPSCMLDPNSLIFSSFANAASGYYTPSSGSHTTLFHPQAGDLHTPSLALGPGLGTPMSMPTSGGVLPMGNGLTDMAGFQPLPTHQLHHFNPFLDAPQQQTAFAPATFMRQDTGYETMEQDRSPTTSDPCDEGTVAEEGRPSTLQDSTPREEVEAPAPDESLRFHSVLGAPTAMIRHADEIPVTYLNKGQAYTVTIADTASAVPVVPGMRYRTFLRVSFEDAEQRQKPAVCWSLWKEGRGTNEAHQRGGKLQAVEFVEGGHPADKGDERTRVALEASSFDGFSILWTPGTNGAAEVSIAVRFNFLSTDFSHSKGVKGIPVRLCAKTTPIAPPTAAPFPETASEICFCKVKLFRDHGAERKLSNDVAHIKKSIDKMKQQIAQMANGLKSPGRRRRQNAISKALDPQHPGKTAKHKRSWSLSSSSSAGGAASRATMEDDLRFKLQSLQDMFTSTRAASVLYLRGEDSDDPDLHPVSLPGDMSPPERSGSSSYPDDSAWQVKSCQPSIASASSVVSPTLSTRSSAAQTATKGSRGAWPKMEGSQLPGWSAPDKHGEAIRLTREGRDDCPDGWIEVLDTDPSYRPPARQSERPVACFYLLRQVEAGPAWARYHRAIYLHERTLAELNERIAEKFELDASRITATTHLVEGGRLEVAVDDDVVREIKEGQDMRLRIEEAPALYAGKEEGDTMMMMMMSDDGETKATTLAPPVSRGLILRLIF